jgi:hypothetical protein
VGNVSRDLAVRIAMKDVSVRKFTDVFVDEGNATKHVSAKNAAKWNASDKETQL